MESTRKVLNIMVGHAGNEIDNHINILKKMKKYENNNIMIYIVLSYGNEEYISEVKRYIKNEWSNKVEIIDNFLPIDKYNNLMSKMDIVILDGKKSYALGNIGMLLNLGKTIYLNEDGIIKEAFDKENIPYRCTNEIGNVSYDSFSNLKSYELKNESSFIYRNSNDVICSWKKMIEDIEK